MSDTMEPKVVERLLELGYLKVIDITENNQQIKLQLTELGKQFVANGFKDPTVPQPSVLPQVQTEQES
jgi:hypothetical protein